jgi:hypothetical protein
MKVYGSYSVFFDTMKGTTCRVVHSVAKPDRRLSALDTFRPAFDQPIESTWSSVRS